MKKRVIVFVIFIICIISIVIGFTLFKIKKNNIEDNKKSENEIVMHDEINKNDNDVKSNNIEKNPESNQKNNKSKEENSKIKKKKSIQIDKYL